MLLMAKQGKGARNKGSSFENKVAKLFSKWTGFRIKRTPMSGGFSKEGSYAGDLNCVLPEESSIFPFIVECKNQECWSFDNILVAKNKIFNFWDQAADEGEKAGKIPLLIVTKNYCSDFMFVDANTVEVFESDYGIYLDILDMLIIKRGSYFLYGVLLEDFLEEFDFEAIYEKEKERK
jgi:hypothetical protein